MCAWDSSARKEPTCQLAMKWYDVHNTKINAPLSLKVHDSYAKCNHIRSFDDCKSCRKNINNNALRGSNGLQTST